MEIKGPLQFGKAVWTPSPAAMRFSDFVSGAVARLGDKRCFEVREI